MNAAHIAGMTVGAIGFCVVIYSGGWLMGLGLFLALFGYGIQLEGNRQQRREEQL